MLIIFLQYMTQFLDITKSPCMGLLSFFHTSYTLKLASPPSPFFCLENVLTLYCIPWRLARWPSGKESACKCRRCKRCRFDPWVWKIPWSRKWQLTPVFLPGKFYGQRNTRSQRVWHSWATEHIHCTPYLGGPAQLGSAFLVWRIEISFC